MTTKTEIIKSIRTFCLECLGGLTQEVKDCSSSKCYLYPFRMGKDPNPSRKGSSNPFFASPEYKKRLKSKTLEEKL